MQAFHVRILCRAMELELQLHWMVLCAGVTLIAGETDTNIGSTVRFVVAVKADISSTSTKFRLRADTWIRATICVWVDVGVGGSVPDHNPGWKSPKP